MFFKYKKCSIYTKVNRLDICKNIYTSRFFLFLTKINNNVLNKSKKRFQKEPIYYHTIGFGLKIPVLNK